MSSATTPWTGETPAVPARKRGWMAALGSVVARWPVWAFGALAALLAAPALFTDLNSDDHYHRGVLLRTACLRDITTGAGDLFSFLSGDAARTQVLLERGLVPWYTDPEIRAAFWRPLAVATHYLDHKLWPQAVVLMHAHSLAWFGLGVAVVAWLYRRLLTPVWVAGVAALFFALDDAHWMPAAYIANRNALIALVLGVLALLAHDAWRRSGWRWGALLAPLLLAAALAGAEAGIAFFGYFLAYELLLAGDAWRRRLLGLVPCVLVIAAYSLHWKVSGYGVANMGFYVDPITEPVRFARAVAARLPLLLLGQWGVPPSEVSYFLAGRGRLVAQCAAVGFLVVLGVAWWPLLRGSRLARFWAGGMVISAIPACATFPSDRLLLIPGIGAMALLGLFLHSVFQAGERPPGRAVRLLAGGLLVVHGVLAPVLLVVLSADQRGAGRAALKDASVPDDPAIAEQTLVLLNGVWVATPIECEVRGRAAPRALRLLAPGMGPLHVARPTADTLVLRPTGGFMALPYERLFRPPRRAFAAGDRVELGDLTIEITELTGDGRPAEARFVFAEPLEDPRWRWRYWDGAAYEDFSLPAIGTELKISG